MPTLSVMWIDMISEKDLEMPTQGFAPHFQARRDFRS